MRFSNLLTSLLLLAFSASPTLAQEASASKISASLASVASILSAKDSAALASATNAASLNAEVSSAIYSLTRCDPSFASWYHSITSVLASLSALESSFLSLPQVSLCDISALPATASTLTTSTGAATAAAPSSTASTGAGSVLVPAMGMGGAFILGVAAWL